jgi:aminocyclopropanecarboxylate oxidase
MMEYRREMKKLAEKIFGMMEELLGLEEGHIKKTFSNGGDLEAFYGTKVSHYPPCPWQDLIDGLCAHAGGLILLFQDDRVGGLQVLHDGQWVDVHPLENAIVINTGDQIEVSRFCEYIVLLVDNHDFKISYIHINSHIDSNSNKR